MFAFSYSLDTDMVQLLETFLWKKKIWISCSFNTMATDDMET